MLRADDIQKIYSQRRERYAQRDASGKRVRDILSNKLDTSFKNLVPAGQEPVVANLIAAGARLMAQRVGRMPRISSEPIQPRFVTTKEPNQKAANRAEAHEKRMRRYFERMRLDMTLLQAAYWLVTHDLAPLVVRPSKELSQPVIEVKDPLSCYPGTVWPHKPDVYDVLFANRVPAHHAIALYPTVSYLLGQGKGETPQEVVLGEYYDRDGVTICLLEPTVHVFEQIKAPLQGEPMVFLARGFSPDLDFHGQFDSVVPALITQAKVTALAVAYIEQMVYAETYIFGQDPEVISNGGSIAYGPNAVNIVRGQAEKLTNNMSQQVAPLIDRLERDIRLGGTFPSQLSGEPTSSIATGKGTEALLTQVDDNTDYWQKVLGDALQRAVNVVPKMAKAMNAPGADDFADDVMTYCEFHQDADPATTVTKLQLLGPGIMSKKDVRKGTPFIDDPDETEAQVEVEQLRGVLLQSLAQQVEQGQLTPSDIATIVRARTQKGETLENVIDFIQKNKAQSQPQQAPDLASLLSGAPGAGGNPAPPGAGQPGPFEGGQPGVGPAGPPGTQPPVPVPA